MVSNIFLFTPKIGKDECILSNISQLGWFNHLEIDQRQVLPKVWSSPLGDSVCGAGYFVFLVPRLMVQKSGINSPVTQLRERYFIYHYLQGFSTIPGGWPWDFWTINSSNIASPLKTGDPGSFPGGSLWAPWAMDGGILLTRLGLWKCCCYLHPRKPTRIADMMFRNS